MSRQVQHKEVVSDTGKVITYYDLEKPDAAVLDAKLTAAFASAESVLSCECVKTAVQQLFMNKEMQEMLIYVSRLPVFSAEVAGELKADLGLLAAVKHLKYFYSIPVSTVLFALSSVGTQYAKGDWEGLAYRVAANSSIAKLTVRALSKADPELDAVYGSNAAYLECADPHAVFPTSIYRMCDGHVHANHDASVIEGVMSTSITTTIKIQTGVLNPTNLTLCKVYKPIGKCVAVVDQFVDEKWGEDLCKYFAHHGVELTKLVYRAMEADKDISTVEEILKDLKMHSVSRNEPVLIVGGGVIADVGGFATALYHRNTAYVMLCTSIVSGIDAGPSPRTCCDGFGYKNLYGAYHPPVLTLTDRTFFNTLKEGWVRHGIAEIVKMAVVKDLSLFELLEKAGSRLITTKFGTTCPEDTEFGEMCDAIIGKAMEGYVKSEYGNLWETHQCRPHAYGHTWSPGYEIPAGMLHGHAVATGMGFGAHLAFREGFITEGESRRIMKLISDLELSLWHPILDDTDVVWASQEKMVQKRGGNLCAPVPKGQIGVCGYINDVSRERLEKTMAEYKTVCQDFPRAGVGIDPHCHDVGLEHPGTTGVCKKKEESAAEAAAQGASAPSGAALSYNEWIEQCQQQRASSHTERLGGGEGGAAKPPVFDENTLFYPVVEAYALSQTTSGSKDVDAVVESTDKEGLFAPCMVGQLEGQFLKMFAKSTKASRVLDVGTFTGYSALSFAEGIAAGGKVVTLESDVKIAGVAKSLFDGSAQKEKIELVVGDAKAAMRKLLEDKEQFDIVFLDADKENYVTYYDLTMEGLLAPGGVILADNSLCSLVYTEGDERRQKLHDFNEHVRKDARVEQVVLTVREGITLIQPLA